MNKSDLPKEKTEDKEPDYYFTEDGLMVFTTTYHLKRGHCCQSGCRHCPWNFKKVEDQA